MTRAPPSSPLSPNPPLSRPPPKASAYFNRGASHNVGVFDSWQMSAADVERRTEWVRHTWTQIEPLTRGQYVNLDLRRSEEHTSELQSQSNLVCRLLLEKKKK